MKSFDHLKHTSDENLDPRLLAACITGNDYRDARKIYMNAPEISYLYTVLSSQSAQLSG